MKQTRKPLSDKEKFRLGLFAVNQVDEKNGDSYMTLMSCIMNINNLLVWFFWLREDV